MAMFDQLDVELESPVQLMVQVVPAFAVLGVEGKTSARTRVVVTEARRMARENEEIMV